MQVYLFFMYFNNVLTIDLEYYNEDKSLYNYIMEKEKNKKREVFIPLFFLFYI